jgi:hypothetical protein
MEETPRARAESFLACVRDDLARCPPVATRTLRSRRCATGAVLADGEDPAQLARQIAALSPLVHIEMTGAWFHVWWRFEDDVVGEMRARM